MSWRTRCNTPRPTAWQNFWWNVEDWIGSHMGWIVAALLGGLLFLGHAADAHELNSLHVHIPPEFAKEKVVPEFENHNLLIKVNWYDTIEEVQEAVENDAVQAYSECEVHYDGGDDIGFCEIWVVRPTQVDDDPHMDSLGHEVLHGLFGLFHE